MVLRGSTIFAVFPGALKAIYWRAVQHTEVRDNGIGAQKLQTRFRRAKAAIPFRTGNCFTSPDLCIIDKDSHLLGCKFASTGLLFTVRRMQKDSCLLRKQILLSERFLLRTQSHCWWGNVFSFFLPFLGRKRVKTEALESFWRRTSRSCKLGFGWSEAHLHNSRRLLRNFLHTFSPPPPLCSSALRIRITWFSSGVGG